MGLYAFSQPVGVLEREPDNWPICEQPSNLCTGKSSFFADGAQILHDELLKKKWLTKSHSPVST